MAATGQNIVVFEDDTFELEFEVEVFGFTAPYNISSIDNVWFGIATAPGNTYIHQKANANWDKGLFTGVYYNYTNVSAFNAGLPSDGAAGNYTLEPDSTSGTGAGAVFQLQIVQVIGGDDFLASFSPQVTNGGIGYQAGDTLTFNASNFPGATEDLVITLTEGTYPIAGADFPPNTGDIEIISPEGVLGPASVKVYFDQSDFDASSGPLETEVKYYWELVIGETFSYSVNSHREDTQVVATGYMYVSSSMFSIAGYRP